MENFDVSQFEGIEGVTVDKKVVNGKIVPFIKIDPSKVHADIVEHPDGRKDVKITLPRLNLFGQPKTIQK